MSLCWFLFCLLKLFREGKKASNKCLIEAPKQKCKEMLFENWLPEEPKKKISNLSVKVRRSDER